jgi:hypothetical protein
MPSLATSGQNAQSAAQRGSSPHRRRPSSSSSVIPTVISRPVSCIGQYVTVAGTAARTSANSSSLVGG